MQSIWQDQTLPRFPQLSGEVHTDVLIIGGGLAGLLTAYYLQQAGIDYVLAEQRQICSGNTHNTTAKLTAQHGLIYDKLLKNHGFNAARLYFTANQAALDEFSQLCRNIDCDFERKDHYVYSTSRSKLEQKLRALERIGCDAELCTKLPLPLPTAGAVRFPDQAQFHPLKFAAAISDGLHIYENTRICEMVGNIAVTERGRITANKVVCATHFPFVNKHGAYFVKLYQHRSYVIALEDAPDYGGMFVSDQSDGLSFRNYGRFLLLGGGGSRTGKKNGNWSELRAFAQKHYPDAREKFFWAAQDCMSLDSMPYVGLYSRRTPNFYVETGFNKWGMTGSMLSAMLIRDLILGKQNDYSRLFNPSRSILWPQLFINGAESICNLLTPSKKVCPHMGCALKWNSAEHSWDCPCHGSRFSEDGKVLDNPANGNLN